jgi:hypothetical protein
MSEQDCAETPRRELARRAREHYEQLSSDAHWRFSIIPKAIDLWEQVQLPLPMVLHCPECGLLHVDAPEPENGWDNPPHKSHKCHGCGIIWRPADIPTNGVLAIETRGEHDTWPPSALR